MLSPQRNYLSAFKKMITVPADLVTSAATTIASPFQRSRDESSTSSASKNSDTHSSSPTSPTSKRSSMLKGSSSSPADIRDPDFKTALHELDTMQDLLSLETVLQLIHVNKDAERRVEKFLQIGFPEVMHAKV